MRVRVSPSVPDKVLRNKLVTKAIDQLPKKHLVRGIIIVIVLIFALFVIFLVLPKIFAEIRYPLAYE